MCRDQCRDQCKAWVCREGCMEVKGHGQHIMGAEKHLPARRYQGAGCHGPSAGGFHGGTFYWGLGSCMTANHCMQHHERYTTHRSPLATCSTHRNASPSLYIGLYGTSICLHSSASRHVPGGGAVTREYEWGSCAAAGLLQVTPTTGMRYLWGWPLIPDTDVRTVRT